jgi:hypothetical protein
MLMDYDIEQHWKLAHIQQPDWSDYKATHWVMNGRSYPDTLLPNHTIDDVHDVYAAQAAYIDVGRYPDGGATTDADKVDYQADRMTYQPISSRIMCNAGDRVLLRITNLGYEEHNMALEGIMATVHGRDASLLKNADGTFTSYQTDTMEVGPGEAYDAIFQAPAHSTGTPGDPPDVYMFYDRNYAQDAGTAREFGGMATEVHVHPANTLAPQVNPNEWGV